MRQELKHFNRVNQNLALIVDDLRMRQEGLTNEVTHLREQLDDQEGFKKKFKDDVKGLKLKHDSRGVLSMGNSGKNSNSSQFFITLAPAPTCNGKHVVMGRMLHGAEVLDLLDATLASLLGRADEVPAVEIVVTSCGEWKEGVDARQGYWAADDSFQSLSGL